MRLLQLRVINKEVADDDVDEEEDQIEEPTLSRPHGSLRHRETQQGTDGDVEHLLSQHRQVQEEMTQDLLNMASSLKSSSVAFGEALNRDNKVWALLRYETLLTLLGH